MALNYTGYYDLVQKLTTDFKADEAINRVTFGDLLDYDRTKETITPCVHIIPNPFTGTGALPVIDGVLNDNDTQNNNIKLTKYSGMSLNKKQQNNPNKHLYRVCFTSSNMVIYIFSNNKFIV